MKAIIRGGVARDNLIIEVLPLHLIGENGEDCWPEQVLQHSTGAAEYSILYTGTWPRQANSNFILPFRSYLLEVLNQEIVSCARCPRLRQHSAEVAQLKRRAYRDQTYWGLPVPSFGDPAARVLILGLAPGAHGSNRTGRPFTGDSSGYFMYPVLYETGFANQPNGTHREDGLELKDAYITAAARCAPPNNKPTPAELANCALFLDRELDGLKQVRVIVALGRIGFDAYLNYLKRKGQLVSKKSYAFRHGATYDLPDGRILLASYHPSNQNTNTRKLTRPMFVEIFKEAARLAHN